MDVGSTEGGGTLHRHHYEGGFGNVPYLSHFMEDLTPYLQCCMHGTQSTCNQYLARRPKGDCRRYVPVIPGKPCILTSTEFVKEQTQTFKKN